MNRKVYVHFDGVVWKGLTIRMALKASDGHTCLFCKRGCLLSCGVSNECEIWIHESIDEGGA